MFLSKMAQNIANNNVAYVIFQADNPVANYSNLPILLGCISLFVWNSGVTFDRPPSWNSAQTPLSSRAPKSTKILHTATDNQRLPNLQSR